MHAGCHVSNVYPHCHPQQLPVYKKQAIIKAIYHNMIHIVLDDGLCMCTALHELHIANVFRQLLLLARIHLDNIYDLPRR